MFTEREADVATTGFAAEFSIKADYQTGPDASAEITASTGATLVPIAGQADGTGAELAVTFEDAGTTALTDTQHFSFLAILEEIVGVGSTSPAALASGTLDRMTTFSATNGSDAGSSDEAEVIAIEIQVTATED